MNRVDSFLSALNAVYHRQGSAGKVLVPALAVLTLCCLCSVTVALLRSRTPAAAPPSPGAIPSAEGELTPTPLFGSDFLTFTPFPTATFFVPTAFPTLTPLPTGSPTSTPIAPTATSSPVVILPTVTNTPVPVVPTATNPPPTAAPAGQVVIIGLNKRDEYAEIQNMSGAPVSLRGWRLVSELGDQSCDLRGTLEPGQVLRIWSRRGNPGFDCRFSGNIWRDNDDDPAVLYNPEGVEVSRFP